MEDYKRLTERDIEGTYINIYEFENAVKKWQEKHGLYDCIGADATQILLARLAELEDKIENGTLVELPCKAGYRKVADDDDEIVESMKTYERARQETAKEILDLIVDESGVNLLCAYYKLPFSTYNKIKREYGVEV